MNILLPQQYFNQSLLMNDHDHNEFENNNMTFTSLDENNSTQSQHYIPQIQNNNYLVASLNPKKQIEKNINIKDKFTNIKPCSLIYSSTSYRAYDSFYAFNILPINLNFLTGKKNFSFLSELNRGVDICEMSFQTQTVHVLYQDIAILPQTFDLLNSLNLSDERNTSFVKKLQQTTQLSNNLTSQINYCETLQNTFNERSKKVINSYFGGKKEKRMFALSSSYNSNTSRQQFSVHFSSEMIHTLGYETDSFMLKCSITGFNEFIMKNDFIQNMESIIEGFANQLMSSSQAEPIKIKQKFCKNQDEAMEAVFVVYMLKDSSILHGAEQIIVFEIQHILDFQVSTKGKKTITKKRQFDANESNFLEKYLKTLSHQQNPSDDENMNENSLDGNCTQSGISKKRKGIAKQVKNNQNMQQQKRKSRKSKDFIISN